MTWLEAYGITEKLPFGRDDLRDCIARGLRDGLSLDTAGVRHALASHLTDRLNLMEEHLEYVAGNWRSSSDLADVLRDVQLWTARAKGALAPTAPVEPPGTFHGLDSFSRWRRAVAELSTIDDKLEMFDRFATIEDEVEPLEQAIDDVVNAIDTAGDIASDVERGA